MNVELPERCPHHEGAIGKRWCYDCVKTTHQALIDSLEKRQRDTLEVITKINDEQITELEEHVNFLERESLRLEDIVDKVRIEADELRITIAEQQCENEALADTLYQKEKEIAKLEVLVDATPQEYRIFEEFKT